jgi:hypothetical protein
LIFLNYFLTLKNMAGFIVELPGRLVPGFTQFLWTRLCARRWGNAEALDSKDKKPAAHEFSKAGLSTGFALRMGVPDAVSALFPNILDNSSLFSHKLWKRMCASLKFTAQVIDSIRK